MAENAKDRKILDNNIERLIVEIVMVMEDELPSGAAPMKDKRGIALRAISNYLDEASAGYILEMYDALQNSSYLGSRED